MQGHLSYFIIIRAKIDKRLRELNKNHSFFLYCLRGGVYKKNIKNLNFLNFSSVFYIDFFLFSLRKKSIWTGVEVVPFELHKDSLSLF